MTDLTKARLVSLMLAAKEGSLVACETPEGVCVGIVDQQGFIPIAAIWPDNVESKAEPQRKTIGFVPDPTKGMVN